MAVGPRLRLYLADLGHNQVTISSDVYPLGVANLFTYIREYLRAGYPPEVTLFREPQHLKAALDSERPDVLALSSYCWNHHLSLSLARYAKRRYPDTICMLGGPNFPLTRREQAQFLAGMPEIDLAVRGQTYEGERAFLNAVQRVVDTHGRLQEVLEEPIAGTMWIDRRTGTLVEGEPVARIVDLDEIPSPYLAGVMDPFWSTGYFPLMQIARGCPFSCQFCNSAVASNNKVFAHSLENVKADLLYAAEHVRREVPLCFADDNFGMYGLDVEVAEYLAWLQDKYRWPRYIRTTTGKNRGERIIAVMRKMRGAMPMTAAVQSMSPAVLENIQRSNIKLETYAQIQREVLAQGMQSYGELILCLPGETKQSFMQGIGDLLDAGVLRISAHQLVLLHGAPLSNPEQRERFQLKTRFRVVARDVGDYGTGEPIVETEEVVVETSTFSFADYLEVRVFHLLLTIFYYEGNFEEAFVLAREHGVKPFNLIATMQRMLDRAPVEFRRVMDDFIRESEEELFATRDEVVTWASQRLQALISGEVGGNLLSKYSMLARFYATHASLNFLELAIGTALGPRFEADGRSELTAVMEYLHAVLLHVPFRETMSRSQVWRTGYDVDAWRDSGYARPLAKFRLPAPLTRRTQMDPAQRAVLESRLETFDERPAALGKFMRTIFAKDLRRQVVPLVTPAEPVT